MVHLSNPKVSNPISLRKNVGNHYYEQSKHQNLVGYRVLTLDVKNSFFKLVENIQNILKLQNEFNPR